MFYQVPILYRDGYRCVQGESPPRLGHFSSPLQIRRHFALPFPPKNPTGRRRDEKLQHTGEHFETRFWCRKSSLKKTWLIQSSNLNSHDAVLDLFNFCIVLYVRFRYFLEFTFAILGFLLLVKKIWKPIGRHVSQCFEGVSGVFWGVCTCSNSIYTIIPMPLYSYLVSPVSGNLEFIHKTSFFFTEKKARAWSLMLYSHWNCLWCWRSLWILLLLPAVLLNTSWDNAMLCSWYKKHLFLEAWLVLQIYRNSNGVKNYWGDFIPMLWELFIIFSFFSFSHTHHQSLHTCLFSATLTCYAILTYFPSVMLHFAVSTLNPVAVFVFDKTISSVT